MKLPKAVFVSWVDSEVLAEWTSLEDAEQDLSTLYSVGFLISENEERIVLAVSFDENQKHANAIMYIPKAVIKSMKVIKV